VVRPPYKATFFYCCCGFRIFLQAQMQALSFSPFCGGSGAIGGREDGGREEIGGRAESGSAEAGAAVSVLECCVVVPSVRASWWCRVCLLQFGPVLLCAVVLGRVVTCGESIFSFCCCGFRIVLQAQMQALSFSPFGGGSGAIGGREEGGSAEPGVAVSVRGSGAIGGREEGGSAEPGVAVSVLECCVVLPFSRVMFSSLLCAALCCALL
jgi:hypothetical protein